MSAKRALASHYTTSYRATSHHSLQTIPRLTADGCTGFHCTHSLPLTPTLNRHFIFRQGDACHHQCTTGASRSRDINKSEYLKLTSITWSVASRRVGLCGRYPGWFVSARRCPARRPGSRLWTGAAGGGPVHSPAGSGGRRWSGGATGPAGRPAALGRRPPCAPEGRSADTDSRPAAPPGSCSTALSGWPCPRQSAD